METKNVSRWKLLPGIFKTMLFQFFILISNCLYLVLNINFVRYNWIFAIIFVLCKLFTFISADLVPRNKWMFFTNRIGLALISYIYICFITYSFDWLIIPLECFFHIEGHVALNEKSEPGYNTLLLRLIPGDIDSACPHRHFHTLSWPYIQSGCIVKLLL